MGGYEPTGGDGRYTRIYLADLEPTADDLAAGGGRPLDQLAGVRLLRGPVTYHTTTAMINVTSVDPAAADRVLDAAIGRAAAAAADHPAAMVDIVIRQGRPTYRDAPGQILTGPDPSTRLGPVRLALVAGSAAVGAIAGLTPRRRVCRCGHLRAAHEHHRRGTDCSACPCTRYLWAGRRIAVARMDRQRIARLCRALPSAVGRLERPDATEHDAGRAAAARIVHAYLMGVTPAISERMGELGATAGGADDG